MSRASTLSGFTTAIGQPTNLNVGVVTAQNIFSANVNLSDDLTVKQLTATEGVTSPGINITGVSTLTGVTATTLNVSGVSTLTDVVIAGVTTINSDGLQSTGIGTFNSVAIGTAAVFPLNVFDSVSNTVARFESGDPSVSVRFKDSNTTNELYIGGDRNDFVIGNISGGERFRVSVDRRIGIGSTAPKVSIDDSAQTDAVALPVGTTAQRPSTSYGGYIRWNSTNTALEVYNGTNWVEIITDYFPNGSTVFN